MKVWEGILNMFRCFFSNVQNTFGNCAAINPACACAPFKSTYVANHFTFLQLKAKVHGQSSMITTWVRSIGLQIIGQLWCDWLKNPISATHFHLFNAQISAHLWYKTFLLWYCQWWVLTSHLCMCQNSFDTRTQSVHNCYMKLLPSFWIFQCMIQDSWIQAFWEVLCLQ